MMAKLMFVDDDEMTLDLMEKTASILGYSAVLCSQGKEAINKAISQKPDIIFIDLGLEDIDGLKLMKMIRETKELSSIPIFIVTAGHSDQDEEKSLAAGASGFLQKPIRFDDLTNAIEKYFKE
jgi:two-component system KDP operon response regulator KdpE